MGVSGWRRSSRRVAWPRLPGPSTGAALPPGDWYLFYLAAKDTSILNTRQLTITTPQQLCEHNPFLEFLEILVTVLRCVLKVPQLPCLQCGYQIPKVRRPQIEKRGLDEQAQPSELELLSYSIGSR